MRRRCLVCGYEGPMKTWLRNYNAPQFILLLLLFVYIIPGLIFLAWGWGKYKCPNCGALGKSAPATLESTEPPLWKNKAEYEAWKLTQEKEFEAWKRQNFK